MDETYELIREMRKLREAIEWQRKAVLNGREVAEYLGCCSKTVSKLAAEGMPRTYLSDDSKPVYSRVAVDEWIAQRTEKGTN